jgi:hypothetical protein
MTKSFLLNKDILKPLKIFFGCSYKLLCFWKNVRLGVNTRCIDEICKIENNTFVFDFHWLKRKTVIHVHLCNCIKMKEISKGDKCHKMLHILLNLNYFCIVKPSLIYFYLEIERRDGVSHWSFSSCLAIIFFYL